MSEGRHFYLLSSRHNKECYFVKTRETSREIINPASQLNKNVNVTINRHGAALGGREERALQNYTLSA